MRVEQSPNIVYDKSWLKSNAWAGLNLNNKRGKIRTSPCSSEDRAPASGAGSGSSSLPRGVGAKLTVSGVQPAEGTQTN